MGDLVGDRPAGGGVGTSSRRGQSGHQRSSCSPSSVRSLSTTSGDRSWLVLSIQRSVRSVRAIRCGRSDPGGSGPGRSDQVQGGSDQGRVRSWADWVIGSQAPPAGPRSARPRRSPRSAPPGRARLAGKSATTAESTWYDASAVSNARRAEARCPSGTPATTPSTQPRPSPGGGCQSRRPPGRRPVRGRIRATGAGRLPRRPRRPWRTPPPACPAPRVHARSAGGGAAGSRESESPLGHDRRAAGRRTRPNSRKADSPSPLRHLGRQRRVTEENVDHAVEVLEGHRHRDRAPGCAP